MYSAEWAIDVYQQGKSIPTVESLMNYRSQGDDDLFEFWCNTCFRPGYGTAAFRDRCKKMQVSDILTVYDEAFIVATVENNYERWTKEAELISNGEIVNKKHLPKQKYTNDAAASKKYQGWSTEGLEFFNKTVSDLNQLRKTSASKVLEKHYMENVNSDLRAKRKKMGNTVPEQKAVDGLEAYMKHFFPNLVRNSANEENAMQGESSQEESRRPNKHQRISPDPKDARSEEEDYDESDFDDDDRYNSNEVGQRAGI